MLLHLCWSFKVRKVKNCSFKLKKQIKVINMLTTQTYNHNHSITLLKFTFFPQQFRILYFLHMVYILLRPFFISTICILQNTQHTHHICACVCVCVHVCVCVFISNSRHSASRAWESLMMKPSIIYRAVQQTKKKKENQLFQWELFRCCFEC